MNHFSDAQQANKAVFEPDAALPFVKAPSRKYVFFTPLLLLLCSIVFSSCGKESFYKQTQLDELGPGCKIIQDVVICPVAQDSVSSLDR